MKSSKAPSPAVAPLFSKFLDCEGGIFHRHDLIQYCSIDNTFQTKSGNIAHELAEKGYEVRVSARTTAGRADSYEIAAKKKG
jgi:hypothetical protein